MILKERKVKTDEAQGSVYLFYADKQLWTVIQLGDNYVMVKDNPFDAYDHPVLYIPKNKTTTGR